MCTPHVNRKIFVEDIFFFMLHGKCLPMFIALLKHYHGGVHLFGCSNFEKTVTLWDTI